MIAVICDACHGRCYIEGLLCPKCNGVGRIAVAEPQPPRRMRNLALLFLLIALALTAALLAK